ncbi:MAG: hypothetical protein JNL02_11875 [Saprospiraceae bacterium]|nr:hypothetical protein [Saprospiraceae bacterium]
MRLPFILFAAILLAFNPVCAQQLAPPTALVLLKKGHTLKFDDKMDLPDDNGFYLYRNCVYDFETAGELIYAGRLVDYRADTFFFTTAFNANVAASLQISYDTIAIPYGSMSKMKFIGDRSLGIYKKIRMDEYELLVRPDTTHHYVPSQWVALYAGDTVLHELVAYHSAQGLDVLYEDGGQTYYFSGISPNPRPNREIDRRKHVRYAIWPTPFYSGQTTINGLGLGFIAWPIADSARVTINGVNAEIFPASFFSLLFGGPDFPYMDSVEFYENRVRNHESTRINGLSASLGGTLNDGVVNGVQVGGAACFITRLNGLTITGGFNTIYEFKGVSIAGVRNRSTRGRGVQIGVLNRCHDLRGVQIGLWNRNGKRGMPLVNWCFKEPL